ncbi:MAG: xylulokinase, partial [Planctomycetota bacterium]
MDYFIGIDTSTTATKALLMDSQGKVLQVASAEYGFEIPHPHWSEQHPQLWWDATLQVVREVVKNSAIDSKHVKGIGLTGQMHGLVLLNEAGEVLRPCILWNDQRTSSQCDAIRRRLGSELIKITGNDALTGFTAPKILWVQENEPEIWSRTRHILLPKDYLRYKLTGEFGTDKAGAAGTLLFDLQNRDWSQRVLGALSIPHEYLPETFEGPETASTVSKDAGLLLGLTPGLAVVGGGGDQAAAAIGTGAVEEGIVSISLGTSGVVFATTGSAAIEPEGRLHSFCHAIPGKWHFMGVILSAAGSLRWFRDTMAPGTSYDQLLAPSKEIPAGSDGLLFLPYLSGERTPYADPLARGAFIGLTVQHTISHMARAVLEGVAYALKDCFELLKAAGVEDTTAIRVTGGGARSDLWLQILS